MANSTFKWARAFGLVDLMVTLAIATLMTAIAVPAYQRFVEQAQIAKAMGDVSAISVQVENYRLHNDDRLPDSLTELNRALPLDPWQRPYRYLNVETATDLDGVRKDGRLNPLSTVFDLYGMGADGQSRGPLAASASRDDIVRANNGAYVGLGEEY